MGYLHHHLKFERRKQDANAKEEKERELRRFRFPNRWKRAVSGEGEEDDDEDDGLIKQPRTGRSDVHISQIVFRFRRTEGARICWRRPWAKSTGKPLKTFLTVRALLGGRDDEARRGERARESPSGAAGDREDERKGTFRMRTI